MSSTAPAGPNSIRDLQNQVNAIVAEIAAISQQDLPPDEYYAEFMQRVILVLGASGGAIWNFQENQKPQLSYKLQLPLELAENPSAQEQHFQLLSTVAHKGLAAMVPPQSGSEQDAGNPTNSLVLLVPLVVNHRIEALVEIFRAPQDNPLIRKSYLRFLLQVCDFASDWLKTHKSSLAEQESLFWHRASEFATLVHESLDPTLTAYTIANEAKRLVGCDRVTVALCHGSQSSIKAISGQAVVESRSNVISKLRSLVEQVVLSNTPLCYDGDSQQLPPQVEDKLHAYLDESHARTISIIPLQHVKPDSSLVAEQQDKTLPRVVGALVFEQLLDPRELAELQPKMDLVSTHAARALTHATDYHSVFFMPFWQTIAKAKWLVQARTLPKTIGVAVLLVFVLASLIVIPASFELEGEAVLQPVSRREVFANGKGSIKEVFVDHGDLVQKGDVLLRIEDPDLEVQLADVQGQFSATEEQLASTGRLRYDRQLRTEERERLGGEILQLSQRRESLMRQRDLLLKKKDQLTVRSPITGQVVTWEVQRTLQHRPVVPGHSLLSVADPAGPWELEISMSENRIGHVAEWMKSDAAPEVNYVVATDPTREFTGKLSKIQSAARLHEEHGHSVSVLVDINKGDLREPRPGATATARVVCGKRALGYVWLHEVWEFVQAKVMFRL